MQPTSGFRAPETPFFAVKNLIKRFALGDEGLGNAERFLLLNEEQERATRRVKAATTFRNVRVFDVRRGLDKRFRFGEFLLIERRRRLLALLR